MASPKTILLTGCNSGIGLVAAKIFYRQNHRLVLVARTLAKAEIAKKIVLEQQQQDNTTANTNDASSSIHVFGCDMSCIESIESFSKEIKNSSVKNIDVLCLNAGMCTARNSAPQFTSDGLELTLATNHFGPFLLTHRLLPMMSHSKSSRIVITSSGVHEKSTFGNFAGVNDEQFVTLDGSEFDYFKAYAQSKLCNVAFCMELNRRLQDKGIIANCFTPGLITSTGLFQHQNSILMKLFGLFANYIVGFGETPEWGGGALAYMATSDNAGKQGGEYWKKSSKGAGEYGVDFVPCDISEEAANHENQSRLWDLSASLVGVPKDAI